MSLRGWIFLILLLFSFGCFQKHALMLEEDYGDCDYSACNSVEPRIAVLEVKFTRTSFQPDPLIFLYLGRYEENTVLDTIRTDTVPEYRDFALIPVNIGHYYTVVAKYIRDKDTIYAVDGSYVTKTFYYVCDSICWEVKGNRLNIKLKN